MISIAGNAEGRGKGLKVNALKVAECGHSVLEAVYTEELGHHLDALLGGPDSAGGEGAILSQSLLQGHLGRSELHALKSENDSGEGTKA